MKLSMAFSVGIACGLLIEAWRHRQTDGVELGWMEYLSLYSIFLRVRTYDVDLGSSLEDWILSGVSSKELRFVYTRLECNYCRPSWLLEKLPSRRSKIYGCHHTRSPPSVAFPIHPSKKSPFSFTTRPSNSTRPRQQLNLTSQVSESLRRNGATPCTALLTSTPLPTKSSASPQAKQNSALAAKTIRKG